MRQEVGLSEDCATLLPNLVEGSPQWNAARRQFAHYMACPFPLSTVRGTVREAWPRLCHPRGVSVGVYAGHVSLTSCRGSSHILVCQAWTMAELQCTRMPSSVIVLGTMRQADC